MIIYLNTTFTKGSIGKLDSWNVTSSVGVGCSPASTRETVSRDGEYTQTWTLDTDYAVGDAGITVKMGDVVLNNADVVTQDGQTITITIPSVTGTVYINIPTKNTNTGEEEHPSTPTNYTFTITPTPSTATVTLTSSGYTQNGNSITVPNGTTVSWSVNADGYTEQTGTWTISGGNKTESIVLSATSGDETEVSFSDDDFEIGAWTVAGAPVELDSRFRTKTTKQFNRDVTFNAVTLPNTSGPTSLRFISNGSQTNWITDSYTVPANTEFHLILARASQSGAVDITKSVTVPEGATKLYVNSLKGQKTNAFAIVNGVTYSGSDFVDGLYHYGEKDASMSILTTSSKAASHQNPIAVTAGDTITIRTFTNGTLGYVFVNDDNTIITVGASIEFMSEYFTPTDYFTYE